MIRSFGVNCEDKQWLQTHSLVTITPKLLNQRLHTSSPKNPAIEQVATIPPRMSWPRPARTLGQAVGKATQTSRYNHANTVAEERSAAIKQCPAAPSVWERRRNVHILCAKAARQSSPLTATGPQGREEHLLKRISKLKSAIKGLKVHSAQELAPPDVVSSSWYHIQNRKTWTLSYHMQGITDPLGSLLLKSHISTMASGAALRYGISEYKRQLVLTSSPQLNELVEDSTEDIDSEDGETPPHN